MEAAMPKLINTGVRELENGRSGIGKKWRSIIFGL